MNKKRFCGTRPIKLKRRTKSQIDAIKEAIYCTLALDNPMTVRQVFYQLSIKGVILKSEGEYKRTICRLLSEMRREGEIPYAWLADATRWMRKPQTYSSLEQALRTTAASYRRSVWDSQDAYCEVWSEKDAIAGLLYQETELWDTPLMVTRGFPSISFLYEAGAAIANCGKPAFIYYFGDYDPSGLSITSTVEKGLREFAPHASINFQRVAVTPEQIRRMKLPTRPTKKTDTRAKNFEGESVEVDAIPPRKLRGLVRQCIEKHIDQRAYRLLTITERQEREILEGLIEGVM